MANGPGGDEVARVSVRAVPDTSKFGPDLKRELKEIIASLELTVDVDGNVAKLKAEIKKVTEEAKKKITLDVDVDSDDVVKKTRRIKNLAQKAVGAINLWANIDMAKTITTIRAQLKIIDKAVQGYRISIPVDLVGWAKLLGYATALGSVLLSIPHILGAIGGAVQVLGGLLATLPAIAAGGAIAISALVVGTQGFFAALGASGDAAAFEEALKKLSPSAQSAARALTEFKEPLGEIKNLVQERLFEGMDESFRKMKGLLGPIKSSLAGAAGGIRDMAKAWIDMATTQESQNDLTQIGLNTTHGLKAMEPVLANIGSALKDFAVVGSSFFVEWGSGLTNVTDKFKNWAAEARKTGEMREWIENAVEKIKQMGRVIADVVAGFRSIFEALRGGESFGDMMERITQSFREFAADKDTIATFQRIGEVIRNIATVGIEVFKKLFSSIGNILKDAMPFIKAFVAGLGVALVGAINILGPMLQALGRWLSENKGWVVPLVIALLSLVTAFKLAATAAKGIMAIKTSIETMRAAAGILGGVGKAFGKMAKAALRTVGSAATTAARWVVAWLQIASAAAVNAAKASAAWIASALKSMVFTGRYYAIMAAQAIAAWVKMAAAAVANALKTSAAWVASWIRMAAVATANAIRMAAAWIIAMGPIAWVIAGIIALVVLIIVFWDEIVAATKAAWDWVWKLVSDVITAVVTWVTDRWNEIAGVFWGVVGWVKDSLSGLWDAITAPFIAAFGYVKGLIEDTMQAMAEMFGEINRGFKGGAKGPAAQLGGRKDGGPVTGGKTYVANEVGEEVFTTMSGTSFLMAGDIGAFTAPATGKVTPHKDISNSLVKLGAGGSGGGDSSMADALVGRVLEAMSNWSWDIQFDPSGVAKMVNKTNLMNRRR